MGQPPRGVWSNSPQNIQIIFLIFFAPSSEFHRSAIIHDRIRHISVDRIFACYATPSHTQSICGIQAKGTAAALHRQDHRHRRSAAPADTLLRSQVHLSHCLPVNFVYVETIGFFFSSSMCVKINVGGFSSRHFPIKIQVYKYSKKILVVVMKIPPIKMFARLGHEWWYIVTEHIPLFSAICTAFDRLSSRRLRPMLWYRWSP